MNNEALISAIDLSHTLAIEPLFEELNLTIHRGDRVALVGTNGAGKSTLLQLLAKRLEPTTGRVVYRRDTWIEYVPQRVSEELMHVAVLDGVGHTLISRGWGDEPWRGEIALEAVRLKRELWTAPFSALSGGEANRALLACALATDPDVLLLDEPTNHLDSEGIVEFERLLEEVKVAFCIVSHDRELLDRCTTRTLILRDKRVYNFLAPYTEAKDALREQDEAAAHLRAQRELEYKKKKATAHRLQQWAKLSDTLAPRYRAAVTELERAKERLDSTFVSRERKREVSVGIRSVRADRIVRLEDISVGYDGRELFSIKEMTIEPSDRVALLGRNGTGKSTLIRRIVAASSCGGVKGITFNPRATIGYYDQELSLLDNESSVFDHIARFTTASSGEISASLARAGFRADMYRRKIATLSGGERARLQFLALRLLNPTLLILDEPTNHLDVQGCESLEEQLLETTGACLFVSHDRRFLKTVANRYLLIDGGYLREIFDLEEYYGVVLTAMDGEPVRQARTVEKSIPSDEELLLRIMELESELVHAPASRVTVIKAHIAQLYSSLESLL